MCHCVHKGGGLQTANKHRQDGIYSKLPRESCSMRQHSDMGHLVDMGRGSKANNNHTTVVSSDNINHLMLKLYSLLL